MGTLCKILHLESVKKGAVNMIGIIGIILSMKSKSSFSKYAFYFFLFSLLSEVYMEIYAYMVRNNLWFKIGYSSNFTNWGVIPSTVLSYASIAAIFIALYKVK